MSASSGPEKQAAVQLGDAQTLDETSLRRVLDAAGVPLASFDAEGHVVSANQAFSAIFGHKPEGLIGTHLVGLCREQDSAELLAALVRVVGRVSEAETVAVTAPGGRQDPNLVSLTLAATVFEDRTLDRVLCVAAPIAEKRAEPRTPTLSPEIALNRRRRQTLDSERLRTSDAESGLPNLNGFQSLLGSAIRRSARTGYPFAVLRCELAGFDAVNDLHGTNVSVAVTEICVHRLSHRLRPSDQITRGAEDTFIVIAEDLADEQDAAGVAYRLLSAMMDPVVTDGRDIELPMTVGIAIASGFETADRIESAASEALTGAKSDGAGGFRIVDLRHGSAPGGA